MTKLHVIKKGKKYLNRQDQFNFVGNIWEAVLFSSRIQAQKHIQMLGEKLVTYQIQKVEIKEVK